MEKTVDINLMGNQHICKYWLHRISHEWDVSYILLSIGYLTIGWSAYSQSGIESTVVRDKDIEAFESIMKTLGEHENRSRWNLWNFCNFQKKDYVLVPLPNGEFSIFRVKSRAVPIGKIDAIPDSFLSESKQTIYKGKDGLLYRANTKDVVDIGFAIQVEPIKEHLSRYMYADNRLTARMKMRQANADISDLRQDIEMVLSANGPINLYVSVIEQLSDMLLTSIKSNLTPDKFERLIGWYFQKVGASHVFRPGKSSRDKWDGADADVVAEFEALKVVFYIQAKLHEDVTSSGVEQVVLYKTQQEDAMNEYTIVSWVITTADAYSPEAISLAAENKVRLITGAEFSRMLIDVGITDINQAFDKRSQ